MTTIYAVIVTYNLDFRLSESFNSLLQSYLALKNEKPILQILIYDNSLLKHNCGNQSEFPFIIKYLHNKQNPGLGVAYNYAGKQAIKLGFEWLLLLDQDTIFEKNFLSEFFIARHLHNEIKLFAPILKLDDNIIFSPCRYILRRGFPLKSVTSGLKNFIGLSIVNSGMIVSLNSFVDCGGYNESIPLDFSDFQFIERFKLLESKFYLLKSVGVQQFSNHEKDVTKLALRYKYFCVGALKFKRINIFDDVIFFLLAIQRATSLFYRTKSFIFYRVFYKTYMKGEI